jgi:8-hydroxy-5-deazaflavin:NADPH oxidoreductase
MIIWELQNLLLFFYSPFITSFQKCAHSYQNNSWMTIVISPIVPVAKTGAGFVYIPLEEAKKPAAEMVADNLPHRSRVVSTFHTISEARLKNISESLDSDTFVCGDDRNIVATVNDLISEIAGLRAIYLGPLSIAYQGITVLASRSFETI